MVDPVDRAINISLDKAVDETNIVAIAPTDIAVGQDSLTMHSGDAQKGEGSEHLLVGELATALSGYWRAAERHFEDTVRQVIT